MPLNPKTKYIFITGEGVSSLGKGIASASIGLLLKSPSLKITILKLDPYINVDPGTLSPYQHGEVYVTDDGAETDEIVELHDHPWYFGVQFHPELKSRVLAGHPLFR